MAGSISAITTPTLRRSLRSVLQVAGVAQYSPVNKLGDDRERYTKEAVEPLRNASMEYEMMKRGLVVVGVRHEQPHEEESVWSRSDRERERRARSSFQGES